MILKKHAIRHITAYVAMVQCRVLLDVHQRTIPVRK
jgi:hypothetical protein